MVHPCHRHTCALPSINESVMRVSRCIRCCDTHQFCPPYAVDCDRPDRRHSFRVCVCQSITQLAYSVNFTTHEMTVVCLNRMTHVRHIITVEFGTPWPWTKFKAFRRCCFVVVNGSRECTHLHAVKLINWLAKASGRACDTFHESGGMCVRACERRL